MSIHKFMLSVLYIVTPPPLPNPQNGDFQSLPPPAILIATILWNINTISLILHILRVNYYIYTSGKCLFPL